MGHSSSWFGEFVAWLTTVGESAGNVLVYSSAYLAFIAMIEVAIVMVLLSLPPSPAPIVLGLVTFAVYANDRLLDTDTDAVTKPQQAAFVRRHRDHLYTLAAIAYGSGVALSVLGGPVTLLITLLPGVFWILYASDWIPDVGIRVKRLKDVLVLNSTVVALAWAISLTFLPLAYAGGPFTWTVTAVFAYFFLRSFVDTEVPNVRDVGGDGAIGVKTLPVVLGVDRTKQVLLGVDLLSAAIVFYAALAGLLPLRFVVALAVGIFYSMGVTSLLGRVEDDELLAIAAEFEYVVVGLVLVPAVYGL